MKSPLKFGVISEAKPGFAKVYFEEDEIVTDWWPVINLTSLKDKQSWPLNALEHVACICDSHLEDGVILGAVHNEEDAPDEGAGAGKFRKVFEDGTILEYDKNAHKLTADIHGELLAKTTQGATIEAGTILVGKASTKAEVEAPDIELKGNVTITGNATIAGNMAVSGSAAITGATTMAAVSAGAISATGMSITGGGTMQSDGTIETSGDVIAGGKSLKSHTHTAPSGGGATSAPL